MSAWDRLHPKVRNALIKDGWKITREPYRFVYKGENLSTDIGAEQTLAADKPGEKIAIEVKSFLGLSSMREFETALGQYQIYRILLHELEPDRKLYLGVSHVAFEKVFQRPTIQRVLRELPMSILVVDLFLEEIVQWID
jgi:XisH protein